MARELLDFSPRVSFAPLSSPFPLQDTMLNLTTKTWLIDSQYLQVTSSHQLHLSQFT